MRAILLFLLMLLPVRSTVAAILTAASCEEADVLTQINAAVNGDTVAVPAGTCDWTTSVSFNTSAKGVTLQGAGIDVTIIRDRVPDTFPSGTAELPFLVWTTGEGFFSRVTGFTFEGVGSFRNNGAGAIQITGNGKTWRFDHNKLDRLKVLTLNISGDQWGVLDHNTAILVGTHFSRVFHGNWDGVGGSGHNSFASPPEFGSEKFIFIEDNTMTWPTLSEGGSDTPHTPSDQHVGGRVVVRYNTITGGQFALHGTEGEANRSGRNFEVYNNTFNRVNDVWSRVFFIRGGSGVVYNNTATGLYTKAGDIFYYRSNSSFNRYGICDGRNPYDDNEPGGPFQTGTATSGSSGLTLADTTKSWTTDQWVGYSIRNVTTSRSSMITGNTATTATVEAEAGTGPDMTFTAGDTYEFWKANACLDQIGNGQTDLMTGTNPVLPQAWTNGVIEGLYMWDNTLNGVSWDSPGLVGANMPVQQALNTSYFLDTPMPGYTPYTYPHPLTVGEEGPPEDFLGWWKLDETSGTVANDELALNPGTLVNLDSNASHVLGNQGRAIACDSDGYVNIPDAAMLDIGAGQNFTAMVRVRTTAPTQPSQYPLLFGKSDTDGTRDEWAIYRAASNDACAPSCQVYFQVFVSNAGYGCTSTRVINDDVWHHLAFVRDGETVRCYHDGDFVSQFTHAAQDGNLSNASPVRLCHSDGGAYAPGVRLDDARLYDRAMPQNEIAIIANEAAANLQSNRGRGRVKWSGAVRIR